MNRQLEEVIAFHKKFRALCSDQPTLIPKDRAEHRYRLMREEVEEYGRGVQEGNLENIAKELCDILYVVYGTIVEHGLQERIEDMFSEVHRSNMSKEWSEYKMIKGKDYSPADVGKFLK